MGFPKQEYWSGLLFPSPRELPNPGIELLSPALGGGFFTPEKLKWHTMIQKKFRTIKALKQMTNPPQMSVGVCVVMEKSVTGSQHTMNMSCLEVRVTDAFFVNLCVVSLCEMNFSLLWFWEDTCNEIYLVKGFHVCQVGCPLNRQISPDGTCGNLYFPFKVEQTMGSCNGQDCARWVPGRDKMIPGHVG